jgi:hypothetical protein
MSEPVKWRAAGLNTEEDQFARALEDHRMCGGRLYADRIYNRPTPALGLVCTIHDAVIAVVDIPVNRRKVVVEVDLHAWWPEEMPDDEELARGIWEALPAAWTDPNIGDEYWISDIRARY